MTVGDPGYDVCESIRSGDVTEHAADFESHIYLAARIDNVDSLQAILDVFKSYGHSEIDTVRAFCSSCLP